MSTDEVKGTEPRMGLKHVSSFLLCPTSKYFHLPFFSWLCPPDRSSGLVDGPCLKDEELCLWN
jgi:hypothetical protein